MAASANPTGKQEASHGTRATTSSSFNNGVNPSNGAAAESSMSMGPTQAALRHNPGLAVEWTAEEQSILEDLLTKYASDSNIVRYAKIAKELNDKTVRDVALRCRWISKKENSKRKKEDHNSARKNRDKKEKVMDSSAKPSSQLTPRPNGPPYAMPMIPVDSDDGISYQAIGGVPGQLLEQNAQVFNQISANFRVYQLQENINLLCQTRDNILRILNSLNDMPEIMRQMPPLPVKVNEELANSILPRSSHQMNS